LPRSRALFAGDGTAETCIERLSYGGPEAPWANQSCQLLRHDPAGSLSGIAFDLNGNLFEQCDAKGNIQSFRVTVAGQPRHVRLQSAGTRAEVGGIAQKQDQPGEQKSGAESHRVDRAIADGGIVPKGEGIGLRWFFCFHFNLYGLLASVIPSSTNKGGRGRAEAGLPPGVNRLLHAYKLFCSSRNYVIALGEGRFNNADIRFLWILNYVPEPGTHPYLIADLKQFEWSHLNLNRLVWDKGSLFRIGS